MATTTKESKTKKTVSLRKNDSRIKISRDKNKVTEEVIRKRAYEIYLLRGMESGNEIDDWTKAENEIKQAAGKGKLYDKDII
jgi:hypothetical protein